jgi:hypothetical protein
MATRTGHRNESDWFSDGLEFAVPVRLDQNLVIPVVSLPVLLVLKLFAWTDLRRIQPTVEARNHESEWHQSWKVL